MLDYKAPMIIDGMMRKYGLKTRVVRILENWPDYNCIELELPEHASTRKIQAVWVDREQYLKSRSGWAINKDPIERWLLEKERAETPVLRPPWAVPGWFSTADHWIHFQLDRLNLQVTGSVQQYRVGWNASCLLWVPTSEGTIYFKAGYAKPPGEAKITVALAKKWPDLVIEPLAADVKRNWMMNRDFRLQGSMCPGPESLPEFARAMARLQVESASSLADWEELGCPRQGLDYLLTRIGSGYFQPDSLRQGKGALDFEEWAQLDPLLQEQARLIRELKVFGIPDMLVHLDFRDDNLVVRNGTCGIIDWTDLVIGHPFQVLQQVYAESGAGVGGMKTRARPISEPVLEELTGAYLKAFRPFGSAGHLEQAMILARRLFPFWKLASLRHELDWAEAGSPRQIDLVAHMQNAVRRLFKVSERSLA
jgi:hypothetical protein